MSFNDRLRNALRSFSIQEFGRGASNEHIAEAELRLDVRLPHSYKAFLREYGWGGVEHLEIYGLGADVPTHLDLVLATNRERESLLPLLPRELVPIMNDGAGNHYCLDTSHFAGDECPVVLWGHELGPRQQPHWEAASFAAWLAEQIEGMVRVWGQV